MFAPSLYEMVFGQRHASCVRVCKRHATASYPPPRFAAAQANAAKRSLKRPRKSFVLSLAKDRKFAVSVDSSVEPAGPLAGKCAGNMRCCKTGTCNEHSGVSRDDCSLEVMCRCVTIPDAVNPCLQGKPTSCPMRHRSLQECSSLCCARDLSFMLAAVSSTLVLRVLSKPGFASSSVCPVPPSSRSASFSDAGRSNSKR